MRGGDRNIEKYQTKQPAMNTQAIASHLNILDSAIIEIQEWASVLWVKFAGGVRFVSKKVAQEPKVEVLEVLYTWGGDRLILAMINGSREVLLGRKSTNIELLRDGGCSAILVTDLAKGKTIERMMDWHYDALHTTSRKVKMTKELILAM